MGKDNLILGTARGKLGDVVFYRTGGEQRFRTRVRPTNPRTAAQCLQRAVVSTAVKYYSEIATVADHAFQNFEGSLKNHQRFMRLNIKMLRNIALRNVYSWSPLRYGDTAQGNFIKKDSFDIAINPYIISEGDIQAPVLTRTTIAGTQNAIAIGNSMSSQNAQITYLDVATAIGAFPGDQVTAIISHCKNGLVQHTWIGRIVLVPSSGDSSAPFMGSGGIINLPNRENYGDVRFAVMSGGGTTTNYLTVMVDGVNISECAVGIIISRFENEKWKRSSSVLTMPIDQSNLQPLEAAVDSYMKEETSSLYLNQADNYGETRAENQGTGGTNPGQGGDGGLEG